LLVIRETMAWFMLIRTMLGSAMRSEVCWYFEFPIVWL
jgi:hypothetical protein